MRKRFRILLAILLLAFVSGVAWQMCRLREPVYQGRNLTEWLDDCSVYPPWHWGEYPRAFNPRAPAAKLAIKEIGTNAIPVLLGMLQAGDSMTTLKMRLNVLLDRQSITRFRFRPGYYRRELAVFGFGILDRNAAPAIPALIGLLKNEHTVHRDAVIHALGSIGPAAKDAVPYLLTRLNDDEASTRYAVTNVLQSIDPEAAAKAGMK
jgi:hypothetical protein